jgi:DNA modification methylase
MSPPLQGVCDVLRTLQAGAYPLDALYQYVEDRADIAANNGLAPSTPGHPHDPKWRHRVRCWLANQRQAGNAWPIKRAVWAIEGTREHPCCLLLIGPGGHDEQLEVQVRDAVELLTALDGPVDAVITDPPWGLRWDHENSRDHYARDESKVLGGYVDVPPDGYLAFSRRWIRVAAHALRPGGQLVVVTGPQAAAHVQVAAEESGLTWISTITALREFVARTEKRPAPAHWSITVMCRGSHRHPRRVFNVPSDQRRSKNGGLYPLDVWVDNGRADRPALLRYTTMLPPRMAHRIVATFTAEGEHVCDPMLGGGEFAHACRVLRRRFTGGDINEVAVTFTAARLLAELVWPKHRQPPLFAHAA